MSGLASERADVSSSLTYLTPTSSFRKRTKSFQESRSSLSSIDLPNGRALVIRQTEAEMDLSPERLSMAMACRKSSIWSVEDAISMVQRGSFVIRRDELDFGGKIGEGAMAVVLKGTWNGKPCAAKMLKFGVQPGTPEYNDLLAELSILTRVGRHKNLVQFYGAHICDPREPIIVQELVDGPDLETFLQRKPKTFNLGKAQVNRWALDILSALDHLHDRDPIIMHRDLKPANILLSQNFKVLKLTDFGLAKQVSQHERMLIAHSGNTGSLRYMAPEVYGCLSCGDSASAASLAKTETHDIMIELEGAPSSQTTPANSGGSGDVAVYSEKADIYSASLVIWYLLTGVQPSVDISKEPEGRPSVSLARGRWLDMAVLLEQMWHGRQELRPSAGECIEYLHALRGPLRCCTMQ